MSLATFAGMSRFRRAGAGPLLRLMTTKVVAAWRQAIVADLANLADLGDVQELTLCGTQELMLQPRTG